MINYGKQTITNIDKKSVLKVLKSNYLTTGPKVKEFERKLIKKFGGNIVAWLTMEHLLF